MATSHPKMSEITRDFLSCSVCLDPFTDPRQLPCLHTFCLKCIQEIVKGIKQGGSFKCPQCRSNTQFPLGGPNGFKKNFFVSGLLEVMPPDHDTEVYCDVCCDNERALSVCVQCNDKLCKLCATHHHRSKLSCDHRVISLKEYCSAKNLEELRAHQKTYCSEHKNEEIKLYCTNCTVPVCLMCKALNHEKHAMKSLHQAANETDENLLQLVIALKEKRKILTSAVTIHEVVTADLNCRREYIIKEINNWTQQRQIEINDLKYSAIKETNKTVEKTIADNQSKLTKLRDISTTIENSIIYTEKLTNHAKDIEKLQQHEEVTRKLQQLVNQKLMLPQTKPTLKLQGTEQQLKSLQVKCVMNELSQNQLQEVNNSGLLGAESWEPCTVTRSMDQIGIGKPIIHYSKEDISVPNLLGTAHLTQSFSFTDQKFGARQAAWNLSAWDFKQYRLAYIQTGKLILLTDRKTATVLMYSRQGQLTKSHVLEVTNNPRFFSSHSGYQYGMLDDITVDTKNNILVTCDGNICIYDVNFRQQMSLEMNEPTNFEYITTNHENEIIVANSNGLVKNYGTVTNVSSVQQPVCGKQILNLAQLNSMFDVAVTKDKTVVVEKGVESQILRILNDKRIIQNHVLGPSPQSLGHSSYSWGVNRQNQMMDGYSWGGHTQMGKVPLIGAPHQMGNVPSAYTMGGNGPWYVPQGHPMWGNVTHSKVIGTNYAEFHSGLHACSDIWRHIIAVYEGIVYFFSSSGQKLHCQLQGLVNPIAVTVGEPGELVILQENGEIKIYQYVM